MYKERWNVGALRRLALFGGVGLVSLGMLACNPPEQEDAGVADAGIAADAESDPDAATDNDAASDPDAATDNDAASDPDAATGSDAGEPDAAFTHVPMPSVTTYDTASQMLLANEINESGEPYAEALGYDLDDLDPAVPGVPDDTAYVLGIENYEYSRYQLGTVISRSGLGLHMMWAPKVREAAAMEDGSFDGSHTMAANGVNEDDELMKIIGNFEMMSGHAAPGNPWPQFAEFVSGDPHLPQAIDAANFGWADFSTLRWDRSLMDKTLNPAAMGQTMMKQYLWASDMLSAYHDGNDDPVEPSATVSPDTNGSNMFDPNNDVFFGGDSLDGFIGMVLTAESINKTAFLVNKLAYNGTSLTAIHLPTYDPANGIQYFPHAIAVSETMVHSGLPPQATGLTVSDASSQLFDQVSFLWATTSFADMMQPGASGDAAHLAYQHVFDGSPFPSAMSVNGSTPGPFDLMKGTSKAIFMNLQAMHHDSANAVYVDSASYDGAVQRGSEVSALASAYLIVALENFTAVFVGTPLENAARAAIVEQADFIKDHLLDGNALAFDAVQADGTSGGATQSLSAQAAAIRGLYTAYRVTGDTAYKAAGDSAYLALKDNYYVAGDQAFRSSPAVDLAVYTPQNFALVSGALREARLEGGQMDAAGIYVGFHLRVAEHMQLSEGPNTGETGGDSDGDGIPFIPEQPDRLPPVFASQATLQLTP